MNKAKSVIRKTLQVIIWVALSFVLFILLIAALVQIPAIQTRIVQYATSYVSNTTHTKVELDKFSISFPKSVVIEGLYLEDTQNDTLLYAGKAKLNITLLDLISNKITLNSFTLDDAFINLYSTESNPLFNYDFLSTAFADTIPPLPNDTLSSSKWVFNLNRVHLNNFRLNYNDVYSGMHVAVSINKSAINVQRILLDKMVYLIDKLLLDGMTVNVGQVETSNRSTRNSGSALPIISAKTLYINNSIINYVDSVGKLSVFADLKGCELKDANIDLNTERINSSDLSLSQSKIHYHDFSDIVATDTLPFYPNSSKGNNWIVSVNKLMLNNNSFVYQVGNKPPLKNEFDPDNLDFTEMNVEATNFYYASNLTKISVQKFNAINQNHFVINSLETDFTMDEYSIGTKNLKLTTPYSTIDADFSIQYTSLNTFTTTYQFTNLDLNLHKVTFKNNDVLYFSPDLIEQPFFKNNTTVTHITGKVNGPLNHLTGKNLEVKTGSKTVLKTDFSIHGLPDYTTATYHFPKLQMHSGKNDMLMMTGSLIPENIDLPNDIQVLMAFKGKMKSFESTGKMNSSFGSVNYTAAVDSKEIFSGTISLDKFDLGTLLKDTLLYGPVSLNAETTGKGLDRETIKAKISLTASQLYLNRYNYQNLSLDGNVAGRQFDGTITLNDKNAVFDFEGLVNLNPGQEQYKFRLNMEGVDLQKLHVVDTDVRLSFVTDADFQGRNLDNLNGIAGVNNIVVVSNDKTYRLDSFNLASVNEPMRSEFNISSPLMDMNYSGTVSPAALPAVLSQFVNNYFPISDTLPQATVGEHAIFNFGIQLHNHPILSEVLFPGLTEFIPGSITGSFNGEKNDIQFSATAKKINYHSIEINDVELTISSDATALNYAISAGNASNAQMGLEHLLMNGKVADNRISSSISSINEEKYKKLLLSAQITKDAGLYKISIDPADFYLMDKHWDISADNYIEFGKEGFIVHNLVMNSSESRLKIASVNNRFNEDLNIELNNFKLHNLIGIIAKDSTLLKGTIDGNILMKRVNDSYGMVAAISLQDLSIRTIPIGTLTLHIENTTSDQFNTELILSGADNRLSANGYFVPNGGDKSIHMKTNIESLSMKTIEAFSMGQITEASGTLSGEFLVEGNIDSPQTTGQLIFSEVLIKPALLNNRIELQHETIQLKTDGLYFNNFTLSDIEQNTAIIDGAIKMKKFSDFNFAFSINTSNFLLMNTSMNDSKEFYGQMIIDSKIDVSGPMTLPVVKARVKMKKGSNFTFIVPEEKLTTDKGENVVEFETSENLHRILSRDKMKATNKSNLTGFNVAAIIEIDKEAKLCLLMDPTSTDSLVAKGEAALSFTMDQSGQMSLTGAYNLSEGSYLVSLESIIKRQFNINSGSTIIWNGDPLDATISINAQYLVQASPYDLVFNQISGLSEADRGQYKQRYPFIVLLKLRGKILQPEISFEIQLPSDHKGIFGGTVNQKLSLLNDDPSTLNKQVFSLLVLGRFVPENPFQAELAGTTSTLVRSTVGKFLSAQLNQLSSKVISGVDLNFDIQSYDDYESGKAQGRTQVEIGLKKQLFKERLSIEVGGTVDVEGNKAKQNSASDISGDVLVEYKLNKDGSFRMKGFRHNQYEGAIEGQLVETGVGVVYVKDFNKWKRKNP